MLLKPAEHGLMASNDWIPKKLSLFLDTRRFDQWNGVGSQPFKRLGKGRGFSRYLKRLDRSQITAGFLLGWLLK